MRRTYTVTAGLLVCALATGSRSQDAAADRLATSDADFLALLGSPDPRVRGEAALALAQSGDTRYHARILAVARDREEAARVRGILALGYLGSPGAESLVAERIHSAPRGSTERLASALALGLLPDDRSSPVFHDLMRRFRGGSYRRHADTLTCLLFGLLHRAHPMKQAALVDLLEDAANKQPVLHRLAIRVVASSLDAKAIGALLASSSSTERLAMLEAAAELDPRVVRPHRDRIESLATRDGSADVRAAALRLLTAMRDLAALEIGVRALRSSSPAEVGAGVEASLQLGGGAIRMALESRILDTGKPAIQEAMLHAFGHAASKRFIGRCLALAADRRVEVGVHVEAAAAAARAGDARAAVVLDSLFARVRDPRHLTTLARAIQRLTPDRNVIEAAIPPTSAEALERLPERMRALLAAGSKHATELLHSALHSDRVRPSTKAKLLRSYRRARMTEQEVELLAVLPDHIAALLR